MKSVEFHHHEPKVRRKPLRKLPIPDFSRFKRVGMLTAIAVLTIVLLILVMSQFTATDIVVSPSTTVCTTKDQILQKTHISSENLLFFSSSTLARTITDTFICIDKVTIHTSLPHSVMISLTPRQAHMIVKVITEDPRIDLSTRKLSSPSAESTSEAIVRKDFPPLVTDVSGILFANSTGEEDLPVLTVVNNNPLPLGKSTLVLNALSLLKQLNKLGISYQETLATSDSLYLFNGDTSTPSSINELILPLGINEDAKIASLKIIIQAATIDTKGLKKLDLRYNRPIAVYR